MGVYERTARFKSSSSGCLSNFGLGPSSRAELPGLIVGGVPISSGSPVGLPSLSEKLLSAALIQHHYPFGLGQLVIIDRGRDRDSCVRDDTYDIRCGDVEE
jgi:hypothetical protein